MTARKAPSGGGRRDRKGEELAVGSSTPGKEVRSHLISPHTKAMSVYGMMAAAMLLAFGMWASWFSTKPGIITSPNSTYDYIIVGAGTAGCVLAARLSADNPTKSILLVEAGPEFSWLSSMPVAAPLLQGSTSNDWRYRTIPQQQSSWGLWNRTSYWPRGKGLGGTGQLNFMLHSLGLKEDFKQWKEKHGVIGWEAETLLPYMKRMLSLDNDNGEEICLAPNTPKEKSCGYSRQSSYEGLIVNDKKPRVIIESIDPKNSPITQAFINAGEEMGIATEEVGEQEYGFLPAVSTTANGQRWSSFNGYLKPEMTRSNLHILLNTHVSKVLFSERKNFPHTAVAVQLSNEKEADKNMHTVVHANHEIILSAGAINSAQILLLSGIGPKKHLHDLKIPLLLDLPVGRNLFDHLNVPIYVSLESPVSITKNKLSSVKVIWDYMISSKGLLASSGVQGVGKASPSSGIIIFGMGTTDEALRDVANFRPDTFEALFPLCHNMSQEGIVMLATCLQPQSRGKVELQHSSSFTYPLIDPNYLSRKEDVACTIEAYRLAVRIAQSKSFQQLGAKVHLPKLPQCQHLPIDIKNDDYLECIIRTVGITGYHPGGTCKMGSADDQSTVVDNNLKVKKVDGLRVMDASILPTAISGMPNSVLIAMAERTADLVKILK